MDALKFFFIAIITFLLVTFVMNKSISLYLEQRYHISFFPKNDILDEANSFKMKLEQIRAVLSNDVFTSNYDYLVALEKNKGEDEERSEQHLNDEISADIADELDSYDLNRTIDKENIKINSGEEFLFIGDSLMQGVALALKKSLKDLNINSIDLSKQNSGLAYKTYFDWAKATQAAFATNNKIKYLVVLLGANDPWTIKNYHFNSPQWLELYTSRVQEIINISKKHNVKIFWYEIPPLKKEDLNEKIQILNQIYRKQVLDSNEIFISTKLAFSPIGEYSSYIKDDNNKSVKVRADDGIHFTYKGAKILSSLLINNIDVENNISE